MNKEEFFKLIKDMPSDLYKVDGYVVTRNFSKYAICITFTYKSQEYKEVPLFKVNGYPKIYINYYITSKEPNICINSNFFVRQEIMDIKHRIGNYLELLGFTVKMGYTG